MSEQQKSAYDVQWLKDQRLTVGRLGCVMLDVTMPEIDLPEEWAYRSEHPDRTWISGIQTGGHATLLYGLLKSAHEWRTGVDEVLEDWEPQPIKLAEVEQFRSPFEDEDYVCLVGRVKPDDHLLDAHRRLSLLPHINTFPEYKAHVTLAYVRSEFADAATERLSGLMPLTAEPIGLNYGDLPHHKEN